ncbi:PREDICTED: uncharacterized protein LOC109363546 [Lupinus angustifolius]|uniref:uncharacterized protein LOC109363546 n=1 Tax=Lupinus angustifolius TaxID=3871 RepID=UPI00092EE6ED|nr:PREDICTED: uncharacterized protein LOC109363546 [Lupinus angustifolius]
MYANTNYISRRHLWSEITSLMDAYVGSWCCIGDFNVILGANEYMGSRIPSRTPSEEFKTFSDNVGLIHLITRGAEFTWSNKRKASRVSSFRFHKMWLKHPDCNKVIEESWRAKVYGCPMFILVTKLKRLKNVLKVWNVNVFGNIHQKVQEAVAEVQIIQNCLNDLGQDNDYLDQEVMAKRNLLHALNMEEEFWKEKARVNWHTSGDRNTCFFHRVTKIR